MKWSQHQMSPIDLVLLAFLCVQDEQITQTEIAEQLKISQSEVSKSMNRSRFAGLLVGKNNQVVRQALLDLIVYGLKYFFPQQPGPVVRGIPTSHSAPPLAHHIMSDEPYVIPSAKGTTRGHAIIPLYENLDKAVLENNQLHEIIALFDALRVGRTRERNLAVEELKKRILPPTDLLMLTI